VTDADPTAAVETIADHFWDTFLEQNPAYATIHGEDRYDDRLDDPGPDGRAAARGLADETLAAVEAIDPAALDLESRITRDILGVVARQAVRSDELGLHVLGSVDQIGGPQTVLPQLAQFQAADTPERLERFIARLRAYPAFMDAHVGNLREGVERGLTAPRVVVERTIAQLEGLMALPIGEAVVPAQVRVASEADRETVRDVVRDVVLPAEREYLRVLRDEYLAASRDDPGMWSAPDGDVIYRTLIENWTTLELDAAEIHEIGLAELELLGAEQRVLARAAGHGDDVAGYRAALGADPQNVPATADAVVARAAEDIERAMAIAPDWFSRLPEAGCVVRPVEAYKERDAPFAYYYPPARDGSRPGTYYVNTFDLPSRLYSKLATTTYHEAVPGHHFQITLEGEHPTLNRFRRYGARLVAGAYVEGWGLYAERLADEMGLFRSDGERFGMLDAQAWRAARLVVDTGLHAQRMRRGEAIDVLLDVGMSPTDAAIETDRYIAWPGHALTYMLGRREIARLRAEIAARDGDAFRLPAFHDAVLAHGALPLSTLAAELPAWVTAAD
jgi:uncharacterized protein (DUF885 family)